MIRILSSLILTVATSVAAAQDHPLLGTGLHISEEQTGIHGFHYVTGWVEGCGLIPVNAHQPACASNVDAFVARISPDQTEVVYATYLGGSRNDKSFGIGVDPQGSAYIIGQTTSTDFPTLNPVRPDPNDGEGDGFIAKFSPDGVLIYSTLLWHSGSIAWDVAVTADATYVAGCRGIDYPDFTTTCSAYVGKLNPAGTEFIYEFIFGGTGYDVAQQIEVDSLGQAELAGFTDSANFPVFPPTAGEECAFRSPMAAKVNAAGDGLIYAVCGYIPEAEGQVTVGLYNHQQGRFLLRNEHAGGAADAAIDFGPPLSGSLPIADHFDGNGQATVGLYDREAGQVAWLNGQFRYGPQRVDWLPVTGDWNGDGIATAGLYKPSTGAFFLKNSHVPGVADIAFRFGPGGLGWLPIAGDWNGNGRDTIGLYVPTTGAFFLKNSLAGGAADVSFRYGPGGLGWLPIAGDWDNDGLDTVGLHDPVGGKFFLKNEHAGGPADVSYRYGPAGAGWAAIAGDWDGS